MCRAVFTVSVGRKKRSRRLSAPSYEKDDPEEKTEKRGAISQIQPKARGKKKRRWHLPIWPKEKKKKKVRGKKGGGRGGRFLRREAVRLFPLFGGGSKKEGTRKSFIVCGKKKPARNLGEGTHPRPGDASVGKLKRKKNRHAQSLRTA